MAKKKRKRVPKSCLFLKLFNYNLIGEGKKPLQLIFINGQSKQKGSMPLTLVSLFC